MKRTAAGVAAGCLLGFFAAEALHGSSLDRIEAALAALPAPPPFQVAAPAPAREPVCPAIADREVLQAELRRALALQPAAAAVPAAPAAREALPEPGPAPAQASALALGLDLVRQAEAQGRWGEEQRRDFRAALLQLDPRGQDELLRSLVPALNEGRIRNELGGPPF